MGGCNLNEQGGGIVNKACVNKTRMHRKGGSLDEQGGGLVDKACIKSANSGAPHAPPPEEHFD